MAGRIRLNRKQDASHTRPVQIYVHPTHITYATDVLLNLPNGLDMTEFYQSLSEFAFNHRTKQWYTSRKHLYYDPVAGTTSIPRYYLKYLVDFITYYKGTAEQIPILPDLGRDVSLPINPWWTPREDQIPAIDFLVHSDKQMRALPLLTGQGKSLISLFALSKIGKVPLIVLNGLIDQWYNVICKGNNGKPPVYDIDPEQVFIIKGFDSIAFLLSHPEYKPSVIIASISTIRNYIADANSLYTNMPSFDEFTKMLGVGVKVHDECHQCFGTIMEIDLRANIATNIYLSATLTRGDKQSRKVFEKVFPKVIQYDADAGRGHIQTIYLPYTVGTFPEYKVVSKNYGYNQNRYETLLLEDVNKKIAFMEFIHSCIEKYFVRIRRPGQRCIVMANTVAMCETIYEYTSVHYPSLKVSLYLGGSDDSVLSTSDIIVSTIKKGGTGTDIPNLKTMINTISIGSEVLVRQVPGRLRKLPDDTPIYVAMYNTELATHVRHYKYCQYFYKRYSKEYIDLTLNQ